MAAVLEGLRRECGADRAAWSGPGGGRLEAPPRPDAVPDASPAWEACLFAAPRSSAGSPRELAPPACARRPVLCAAGIRRVRMLDLEGPLGRRRLVLGGGDQLAAPERTLAGAAQALCGLEAEQRAASERERGRQLALLGLGAAGAAHDLRNLLSTAVLESQVALGVEGAERLRGTLEEAVRLARDFLAGEPDLARDPVRLAPLLEREVRRRAGARGEVRLVGVAPDLWVAGRADLLGRVLQNVISNALEASPRGRGLEVLVREPAAAGPRIEIRDRGRGMDLEGLRRLLEPGQSGVGGTGFGTASALACLARVGGSLELESEAGRGTSATIRLLRSPPAGAGAVLVADDDDAPRRERCEALEAAGAPVAAAASAREARAWLAGGAIGRALVARGMPGARELAASAPHSIITEAATYSRFMRAMVDTLMPLGQAASHS